MRFIVIVLLALLAAPFAAAYGVTFYNPAWNPQYGKVFELVEANKAYSFDIKNPDIAITKITFTISREVKSGGITVYYLKSKPSSLPDVPENDTYQLNELKYVGFVPYDTTKVVYDFKVPKGWLENMSVARDMISLQAYNSMTDAWETIKTSITGEDSDFVLYRAEGKGVHYLLVGKSQSGAVAEAPVQKQVEENVEEPKVETPAEVPVTKVEPVKEQPVAVTPVPQVPSTAPPATGPAPANTRLFGTVILLALAVMVVIIYLVFSRKSSGSSVDKELHNYIGESLKRGKTKDEVKHRLLEVGWHHERVEKALSKHKDTVKPVTPVKTDLPSSRKL
jgi:PGF-pre-PGF domain-containing protein